MRKSKNATTLAILRDVLGFKQAEFAEYCGHPHSTFRAVENEKRKLSARIALAVTGETGVDYTWLINGDINAPIIDLDGKPYTREKFEKHRASKRIPSVDLFEEAMMLQALGSAVQSVCELFLLAYKASDQSKIIPQIEAAIEKLCSRFGHNRETGKQKLKKIGAGNWEGGSSRDTTVHKVLDEFFKNYEIERKNARRRAGKPAGEIAPKYRNYAGDKTIEFDVIPAKPKQKAKK